MTAAACVWLRVSTTTQDTANQVADIERFCTAHDFRVVRTFQIEESAWNGGKQGGGYQATLKEAMDAAWRGEFSVLVCWALDRITREGAEGALRLIRMFRERGCTVLSVQESWLNGSPEVQDVLVAFAGWQAEMESARRSERIKAGLQRRRAEGKHVGRVKGARDLKPRRKSGYFGRWENERDRRARVGSAEDVEVSDRIL
jgi:DNA invertase Pin-like site-specific DNA recombinase